MTSTRRVAHGEKKTHFKHGTIFGWRTFVRFLWLRPASRHIAEVKWLDGSGKSEIRHWTKSERRLEKINTTAQNHSTMQISVLVVQNLVQGRSSPSSIQNKVTQAIESTR